MLADLLGLEKLTNSFGLLVVFRGVASLAGSPFAGGSFLRLFLFHFLIFRNRSSKKTETKSAAPSGLVYDFTKSYDMCFYFAGGVIAVSGLISCGIPFIHRWRRSHGENEGTVGTVRLCSFSAF